MNGNLNIMNFRDLGGYKTKDGRTIKSGLIFRGAALDNLNSEDIKIFKDELKIKYVLDFRSDEEERSNPDIKIDGINYYHKQALQIKSTSNYYNFIDLGINKESVQRIIDLLEEGYEYTVFSNEAYQELFNDLLRNDGAIYFHCTAGKDRTGMAALLIMLALDVDEETCVKEYLKSNKYLKDKADLLASKINLDKELYEMSKPLLMVEEKYIRLSILAIKKKYQSFEEFFLNEYHLDKTKLEKLRSIYLE